jgi:hypothetical protein
MSGMITYLNRLGPENLGDGYAGPIDRRMAAGLMALSFRFRLRDVARLIADALAPGVAVREDRPVHLFNIGGGPAADSLNGLILIHKEHPGRLRGRRISIAVLGLDAEGPSFGSRALSALLAENAPLGGLYATFQYVKYDWSGVAELRKALAGAGEPLAGRLGASGAEALLDYQGQHGQLRVTGEIGAGVCSSEGGLFDYASDEDIVANLTVLRDATPADFVVVGSVVRDVATLDSRLRATTLPQGRPRIRYLGLDAFRLLARRAGWSVDRVIDSVAHHAVTLEKAI